MPHIALYLHLCSFIFARCPSPGIATPEPALGGTTSNIPPTFAATGSIQAALLPPMEAPAYFSPTSPAAPPTAMEQEEDWWEEQIDWTSIGQNKERAFVRPYKFTQAYATFPSPLPATPFPPTPGSIID